MLIIYAFGKYIVPLISPFIFAWIIALILQPPINFLEKRAKIPRSVSTIALILLLSGLVVFLGYIVISELIGEVESLSLQISSFFSELKSDDSKVSALIEKIDSYVPVFDIQEMLHTYWSNIDDNLISLIQSVGSKFSSDVVPFLTGTVTFVADFFIVSIISVVAVYYIAVDFKKINKFILAQFPEKPKNFIVNIKNQFFSTTWKYIKAYSIIIVITFFELLIAFYALNIEYPYLIALITALVDILPVIGTGTILIPWGIFLILTNNVFTGIGILVTYVIVTIIRQIIEPKIVGSYIGMYPLITLIMMYSGLKAFGILGLFAFPIFSIIIKNLNDSCSIKLWKYPEGMGNGNKPPHPGISTITEHILHPHERDNSSPEKKTDEDKEK